MTMSTQSVQPFDYWYIDVTEPVLKQAALRRCFKKCRSIKYCVKLLGCFRRPENRIELGENPVLGSVLLMTHVAIFGWLHLGLGQSLAVSPDEFEIAPIARFFGKSLRIL